MISVFYDDGCPLCRREIEYYKKISSPDIISWCAISQHIYTLEKYGISYTEGLKILDDGNTPVFPTKLIFKNLFS